MASSKYISTRETTHAARLSRLLLDPCTDLFRELLRSFITEVQFPHILQNGRAKLSIINKDQRNLLYPKTGPFQGTYENFDLSMLYTLLRNISGITSHKNGWGKQPDPKDRSLSANIDRIRGIRNTYCGHAPRVTLSDIDFQRIWQDMTVIMRELEGNLTARCTTYTDAANLIKTDTMDPEQEKTLLDIIDKHQDFEGLQDSTTEIIKIQEKLHQEHQLLRAEQDVLKSDLLQKEREMRSRLRRQEKELKSALQEQKTEVKYKHQKQEEELKFMLQKHDTEVKSEQQRLDIDFKSALKKQDFELKTEIQRQGLELNAEQLTQKKGIEVVTERVACLEKRSCERSNILDNTTVVLQTQKIRSVYIRTSAVDKIREKLGENKILILTGKAGCGKTTTAYQVMLELSEESSKPPYKPAIIHSPDEWNKVINPYQRHIVFLDDFMGSSNFDRVAIDKWNSKFYAIIACATNGQVLSLIGLRRNILDEAEKYDMIGFFHNITVIDLSMDQYFTLEDKEKMFAAYEAKCSFKDSTDLHFNERSKIISAVPYYGFPLTCFQFFSVRKFYQLGPAFFLHANELMYNAIEYMRKSKSEYSEKVSYCVLCYVFIQGSISKNAISFDLFKSICEKLRISNVPGIDIWDAIDDLNGVYLSDIETKNKYVFSHETVMETVVVSFGQLAPDIIIKRCSMKTFNELIRTENYDCKPGEVVLKIPQSHFEDLAQRILFGDDSDDFGESIIFQHQVCQDPEFLSVLLNRDISLRFASILSYLCEEFRDYLYFNDALVKKMLQFYGPHFLTSESMQRYRHIKDKLKKPSEKSSNNMPIVLTDEQLSIPNLSINELDRISQEGLPFVISRYCLASALSGCLSHYKCETIVLSILHYIKTHQNLHDLLGILYVPMPVFDNSFIITNPLYGSRKVTPLHLCVLHGWEKNVEIILTINKPTTTSNDWTCAHLAAYGGRASLLQKFINLGQDVMKRTTEGYAVFQTALLGLRYGSGVVPEWRNKSGRCFLNKHLDDFLLLRSVSFPGEDDFDKVIRILLNTETTCVTNDLLMEVDEFGNGIAHYLVIHNYHDILNHLLEYCKVCVFQRNKSELPTTLHLAVYLGRRKLVQALWEAGVRPGNSDLSLLETLDSGGKFCNRKIECCDLWGNDDEKTFWNESRQDITDIKLRCVDFGSIKFGSNDDFHGVRCFLQEKK